MKLSSLFFPSVLLTITAMSTSACLDPLVSDEYEKESEILPAGTEVPNASDTEWVSEQIADNDGVSSLVPLIEAYAEGEVTRYWDFGETPDFAAPLFALVRKNASDEFERIDHPTIINAIPGDPGYSPFWAVILLEVSDSYAGELITSFAAVEDAIAQGIVKAPVLPSFAINCPVVADEVHVEVGDGNAPEPPPYYFFWRGKKVYYFDFGLMPLVDATHVPPNQLLLLKRQGEEILSEPLRGVDMTGDQDTSDTNNIFKFGPASENLSPLCQQTVVTLSQDYVSIDNLPKNQSSPDIASYSQIFNPDAQEGVLAFEEQSELINCPQQARVGEI